MIYCYLLTGYWPGTESGLSATMDVRIVYFDVMRPFAEAVLGGCVNLNQMHIVFLHIPSLAEERFHICQNH